MPAIPPRPTGRESKNTEARSGIEKPFNCYRVSWNWGFEGSMTSKIDCQLLYFEKLSDILYQDHQSYSILQPVRKTQKSLQRFSGGFRFILRANYFFFMRSKINLPVLAFLLMG